MLTKISIETHLFELSYICDGHTGARLFLMRYPNKTPESAFQHVDPH